MTRATSRFALSPARRRMSSTSQRDRPRPGAGKIRYGRTETRQRLTPAAGNPRPRSVCAIGVVPDRWCWEHLGQLQVARRGHREARRLCDDSAEPAMAQPFLETDQKRLLVVGLSMDHSVGRKAGLGDRRCEGIGRRDHPKHLSFGAHSDPGCQQRGLPPATSCSHQTPALVPDAFGRRLAARRTGRKRTRPSGLCSGEVLRYVHYLFFLRF